MLLDKLMKQICNNFKEMGEMSARCITLAVESLVKKDIYVANYIINELEPQIDEKDRKLDELCIETLARYSPEASDLRIIVSIMKINRDLERIGDHARNIAKITIKLAKEEYIKPLIDIPRMGETTTKMINDAVKSFLTEDLPLAKQIISMDKTVDELYNQINRELITYIMENPKNLKQALDLMNVSKNLERVGDLATNIAEYAIFTISGKDIRHRH